MTTTRTVGGLKALLLDMMYFSEDQWKKAPNNARRNEPAFLYALASKMGKKKINDFLLDHAEDNVKTITPELLNDFFLRIQKLSAWCMHTDASHEHDVHSLDNVMMRAIVEGLGGIWNFETKDEFFYLRAIFPAVDFRYITASSLLNKKVPYGLVLSDDGKHIFNALEILETAAKKHTTVFSRSADSKELLTPLEIERVKHAFGEYSEKLYEALEGCNDLTQNVTVMEYRVEAALHALQSNIKAHNYQSTATYDHLGVCRLAQNILHLAGVSSLGEIAHFMQQEVNLVNWARFAEMIYSDMQQRASLIVLLANKNGLQKVLSFCNTQDSIFCDVDFIKAHIPQENYAVYLDIVVKNSILKRQIIVKLAKHIGWENVGKLGMLNDLFAGSNPVPSILSFVQANIEISDWFDVVNIIPDNLRAGVVKDLVAWKAHAWQKIVPLFKLAKLDTPEYLAFFLVKHVPSMGEEWLNTAKEVIGEDELAFKELILLLATDETVDLKNIFILMPVAGLHNIDEIAEFFYQNAINVFDETILPLTFFLRLINATDNPNDKLVFIMKFYPWFKDKTAIIPLILPILTSQLDLANFLQAVVPLAERKNFFAILGKRNLIRIMLYGKQEEEFSAFYEDDPQTGKMNRAKCYQSLMTQLDSLIKEVVSDEIEPIVKLCQAVTYLEIRKDGPDLETVSGKIFNFFTRSASYVRPSASSYAVPTRELKCKAIQLFIDFCLQDTCKTFKEFAQSKAEEFKDCVIAFSGSVNVIAGLEEPAAFAATAATIATTKLAMGASGD